MSWHRYFLQKRCFLILATILWTIFLFGYLLDSKYTFVKKSTNVQSTSTKAPEQLVAAMGKTAPKKATYPTSPAMIDFILASEKVRMRFLEKRTKHIGPKKLSAITPGGSIWDYFTPTISCPFTTERIGRFGDGGKWVCGFEFLESWPSSTLVLPSRPCVAYSFGVSTDSSFESEILDRTPCHIYSYDPTVFQINLNPISYPGRVTFEKVGLGHGGFQSDLKTLGEIMKENGHEWIDLLKIDIEGGEFDALDAALKSFGDDLPFSHLNVEVHLKNLNDGKQFMKYYEWWTRLENKGLRAYKIEANYGALSPLGIVCVEYSFVNIKPFFFNVESGKLIN